VQGCFDISSLQTMLKINSAKSIKTAVPKEIKWFAAPYDILATVHQLATTIIILCCGSHSCNSAPLKKARTCLILATK